MAAIAAAAWSATAAVEHCPVVPWSGSGWRCHARRYAGDDAAGSRKASGRFHRGIDKFPEDDTWPALYTSLGQHVALGERLRHTTPESLHALANQRISELRVSLSRVLVACAATGCADLDLPGLTVLELCQVANYAKTQEFAKRAREVVEALLVPSCTRFRDGNLIVFPDRLRRESIIRVVDTQDPDLFIDWVNLPEG